MIDPSFYCTIYYNSTASFGTAFVLDDATQGKLNSATYTLADEVATSVESYISDQITITRGRSRETDQYQAGTASFTLRNEDRRFDPSNTAAATGIGLIPRLRVEMGFGSTPIFVGYIDDIQVRYEQPNICVTEVTCIDAFSILANAQMRGFGVGSGLPGSVLFSCLLGSGFKGDYNLASGYNTIQSSSQSGTDFLTYMQTVARSDNGHFFVARDGTVTFKDRYTNASTIDNPTYLVTDDPTVVSGNTAAFPYTTISQKSQSLLLYNQISGTRTGGTQQVANDTASQAKYLVRGMDVGQLENNSDATVASLCGYLIGKYANPDVRFDVVSISMQSLPVDNSTATRIATMAKLELTQLVQITRTPAGTGTPASLVKMHMIEGISWSIDVSSATYDVTLNFASTDQQKFFVLDSTGYGLLNTNLVAY